MAIDRTAIFAVPAAAVLMLWPALWNGFPIVFADTGTYLSQAIHHYAGWDRPVFYSLFMLPLHQTVSVWPVVVVQALLASWVLWLVVGVLVPGLPGIAFVTGAGVLSLCTWLPWLVSELMPDLFTPLLVLVLCLLAWVPERLSSRRQIALAGLAAFMIASQLSSLPLACVLGAVLGFARPAGRVAVTARVAVIRAGARTAGVAGPALPAGAWVWPLAGREYPTAGEMFPLPERASPAGASAFRSLSWLGPSRPPATFVPAAPRAVSGRPSPAMTQMSGRPSPAVTQNRSSIPKRAAHPFAASRRWLHMLSRRGLAAMPRRWLLIVLPPALAMLCICTVNFAAYGRFSTSPFGNVFLLARVIYDGPGMTVLRRDCPTAKWRLCPFLDRFPSNSDDFLWTKDSPLRRAGGPKVVSQDAGAIIEAALLLDPVGEARAVVENTLEQLTRFASGDGLNPWPGEVSPGIESDFPARERTAYASARQQSGTLWVPSLLSWIHPITALGGVFGCIVLLPIAFKRRAACFGFLLAVLITLPLSAAITGGLSAPHDRYQARIMWLAPFVAVVSLASLRRRPA